MAASERTVSSPRRPPDGGYGWVIVLVSHLLLFITASIIISFTVLYIEFSRVFQLPKGVIGWINSIQTGTCNFTGLFVSVFVRRYGARPVAVTGTVLAVTGILTSTATNSVYQLYITLGFITGVGIGSMLYAALVVAHQWFDERRALAAGLAAAGLSVGNIAAAPIVQALIDAYGWRGSLLLMAGMALHGLPLSMLLRPTPWRHEDRKDYGKFTDMWKDLLDFRLMRQASFTLYCLGTLVANLSLMAFLQHLGSRAYSLGFSLSQCSLVPTWLASFTLAGRIMSSFIANCSCTIRILMYAFGVLAGGVVMVTSCLAYSYVTMAVFAAAYGVTMATYMTIQQTVLVDLLGMSGLLRGQAILTCFLGIGAIISTPLAGLIFDLTQNYDTTYISVGSLQVFGSLFVFVAYCATNRSKSPDMEQPDVPLEDVQQSNVIYKGKEALLEETDRSGCVNREESA